MPLPEIEREQKLGQEVVFRADTTFAKPEAYQKAVSRNKAQRIAAQIEHHAGDRYFWLFLAESHLTRRLFGTIVGRIAARPLPAG